MAIKKRMVGIVGVGHVGAHVAFNLGMMGIADEVLLCDLKESKVTSEVQDLNDASCTCRIMSFTRRPIMRG